jgi:hypothetical protein
LVVGDASVHASWHNQIEIYFSIARKVLTPNDLIDLNALAERILDFYPPQTNEVYLRSRFGI